MRKIFLVLIYLFFIYSLTQLVGCATTTQDAEGLDLGTTQVCFKKDIAIITYSRYPYVPEYLAEDYLFFRCAEVTIEHNYDFFEVLNVFSCPPCLNIFNKLKYKKYTVNKYGFYPVPYKVEKTNSRRCYLFPCDRGCNPGLVKVWIAIRMHGDPFEKLTSPPLFNAQQIVAYLQTERL